MAEKDGVETKNFPPRSNCYRPRCFFDVQINKVEAGRLIFELFPDVCPKTSENFRALCTGEKGEGKTTSKPLHYKNTVLHRIVKNFIIQGGDFSAGDGTGGESIYGGTFKDENFVLQHDRPFLLSMANCGANTNGSQFFITLAAAHHLDNVHTVFGHVLFGQDIVRDMENQKVNANHKPYADIRISHCGELIKKAKVASKKPSKPEEKVSSSESSSSSDTDSKHRKKRKVDRSKANEKPTKKEKVKEKEYLNIGNKEANANEPTDGDLNFIPTVPSTFLMRRSRTPSPVRERRRKEGLNNVRRREPVLRTRVNMVSRSGKKLRGRGVMRYRTPTPESTNDELDEEVSPTGAGDGAIEKLERLSEKSKEKERRCHSQENELRNEQKPRNHRRAQSKSNDKRRSLSKSNDKILRRSRSRSRSRERRRPKSRSRLRRKSRSPRDRRHSRSIGRYRQRSRSFERRRNRYMRRTRSRSRRRSPRNRSRSLGRHRSPRNSSRERKGKFERHRSKSGSGSDSSQERKKKLIKDEERKVEKLVTDKPTIKEKIDRLFQKKEEENKAALAAAAKYKAVDKTEVGKNDIADFFIANVTPAPLNINEFQCRKETSESQTLYPAIQNENTTDSHTDNTISESQKIPPPHSSPRYEICAIKSNADHIPFPNLKDCTSSKVENFHSFPTGIDEKSSLARRDVYGDDFIATSIEEENISGYLFEAKDNSHAIKGDFHTKADSHCIEVNSHSTDVNDTTENVDIKISKAIIDKNNQGTQVHQSVDEINKSKGKIGELQEQIREYKQYKYQLSEKIDFSTVSNNNNKKVENGLSDEEKNSKVVKSVKCKKGDKLESDSRSGNEDSGKTSREKKRSDKLNKRHSHSENGKDDGDDDESQDDESQDDEKVPKKKGKKRKDRSSSELSDIDRRKKKDRRKHDSRKSRKRHRSERTSSSSRSESDNEMQHKGDSHHSEKPTDADDESTVEADRDRKKNKKNKHKRKRTTTERSHNSEEGDNSNKRRKQKRKVKRRDTDYNSDNSEEYRKRRSKRRRKKRRESSSEDISEDDYQNSRKRKLKSYEKKRDRKRKKRRNSIST